MPENFTRKKKNEKWGKPFKWMPKILQEILNHPPMYNSVYSNNDRKYHEIDKLVSKLWQDIVTFNFTGKLKMKSVFKKIF